MAPRALFAETVLSASVTTAAGPSAATPAPAAMPGGVGRRVRRDDQARQGDVAAGTRMPPPAAA